MRSTDSTPIDTTPRRHDPPTRPTVDPARRRVARWTGVAYLGIVATGIFAEFAVRGTLVVADDPTATATNIAASPGLFGVGIAADVVMVLLDVAVAVGLFRLLREVDRRLALTATVLRLVQGAIIALGLVSLFQALAAATRDGDGAATGAARDALDAVERHALVYDAGLIAFGLSCLVVGRILLAGRLVPRILAVGLVVTGVVYLIGSFAALFAPDLSAAIDPFYAIAIVVEPAFAVWLIVRGLPTTTRPATTGPATTGSTTTGSARTTA